MHKLFKAKQVTTYRRQKEGETLKNLLGKPRLNKLEKNLKKEQAQ